MHLKAANAITPYLHGFRAWILEHFYMDWGLSHDIVNTKNNNANIIIYKYY